MCVCVCGGGGGGGGGGIGGGGEGRGKLLTVMRYVYAWLCKEDDECVAVSLVVDSERLISGILLVHLTLPQAHMEGYYHILCMLLCFFK